jgi:hypothetical protein
MLPELTAENFLKPRCARQECVAHRRPQRPQFRRQMRDDADVDPRGRASARTGAARIRHALVSAAALRGRTRTRRIELYGMVCGCGQARRRADGPCPPMSPVAVLTVARVSHRRSHPVRPYTPQPADAGRRTAAAADGRCSAAAYVCAAGAAVPLRRARVPVLATGAAAAQCGVTSRVEAGQQQR